MKTISVSSQIEMICDSIKPVGCYHIKIRFVGGAMLHITESAPGQWLVLQMESPVVVDQWYVTPQEIWEGAVIERVDYLCRLKFPNLDIEIA